MNNPFSLEGKNIIITGASSGIGRQCAISCSQMGARICLIARNTEKLAATIRLMNNQDIHQYISMDISEFSKIESVIANFVEGNGKISGFIHSAGTELTMPIVAMKPDYYQKMNDTNVISAFEFSKHISKKKYFSETGCSLVYISSVMSEAGENAHLAYCASKGALTAGARALALELASKKIRVNTISPGQIENTEITNYMLENFSEKNKQEKLAMHPLGYGQTEDVANACVFLLSDAGRWITGTNLVVDGGYLAK